MSTISNENVTKRGPSAGSRDTDDLANQIEAIRSDLQNLTSACRPHKSEFASVAAYGTTAWLEGR